MHTRFTLYPAGTHSSNSGCRVLNITKSSNLREEGLSGSLPHLMALGLANTGECLAKCTAGLSGLCLTWLTALHPSDVTSEEASVTSEVCASSTLTGPWWRCIPHPFQVLLLSPEWIGQELMLSGVILALQLLSELQHREQGAQHAQPP